MRLARDRKRKRDDAPNWYPVWSHFWRNWLRLTAADRADILTRLQADESAEAIARDYRVHTGCVRVFAKRNGIT